MVKGSAEKKETKPVSNQEQLRLQVLKLLSMFILITPFASESLLIFLSATISPHGADRQPINLLFEEIIFSYRNLRHVDKEARGLIQQILGNFSESVEFQHRIKWDRMTKETPEEILPYFRKKLDLVAFRVNGRLSSAIDNDVSFTLPITYSAFAYSLRISKPFLCF